MSADINPAHARLFVRLADAIWTGAIDRDDLARWMTDAGVMYDTPANEPCGVPCFCEANNEFPTICSALNFDVLGASWKTAP